MAAVDHALLFQSANSVTGTMRSSKVLSGDTDYFVNVTVDAVLGSKISKLPLTVPCRLGRWHADRDMAMVISRPTQKCESEPGVLTSRLCHRWSALTKRQTSLAVL